MRSRMAAEPNQMKKLLTFVVSAAMLLIVGCGKEYDDSALSGRVDTLENRVSKLEELCKHMNTNISSLQTLINGLQTSDYITSITPIVQDGQTIGYTITFAKNNPITIFHGKNGAQGEKGDKGDTGAAGQSGSTPQIGVKYDIDGVLYWTLNGDWMLDSNGQKIRVIGEKGDQGDQGEKGDKGDLGETGTAGITPQLKIENEYWYISYDNGTTWNQLGKATGETGDSFFSNIDTSNPDYVVFTLAADGTEIKLTRAVALEIAIATDVETIDIEENQTYKIPYTITGANEQTIIDVVAQDDYTAEVVPTDYQSGFIMVTTPATSLKTSRVLVFVSRGTDTIMRVLNFIEKVIIVSNNSYKIDADGATISVELQTNLPYDYMVEIPEEAKSWIHLTSSRGAVLRTETLTFTVDPNLELTMRHASINLKKKSGKTVETIFFQQTGAIYEIHYTTIDDQKLELADDSFESQIESNMYENGKGTIVCNAPISVLSSVFLNKDQLKTISLPNGVKTIDGSFQDCRNLTTVILPKSVTHFVNGAFKNCTNLSEVVAEGLQIIGDNSFRSCENLAYFHIPNGVTEIQEEAFSGCESLSEITIPDSVTEIGESAFSWCESLSSITLGKGLKKLCRYSFSQCNHKDLVIHIPDNIEILEEGVFNSHHAKTIYIGSGIKKMEYGALKPTTFEDLLQAIYIKATTPPILDGYIFTENSSLYRYCTLYVPVGSKASYANSKEWGRIRNIEEIVF